MFSCGEDDSVPSIARRHATGHGRREVNLFNHEADVVPWWRSQDRPSIHGSHVGSRDGSYLGNEY